MLKNKKVLIPLLAALGFLAVYMNVFRGGKDEVQAAVRRSKEKKTGSATETGTKTKSSRASSDPSAKSEEDAPTDTDRNPFLTAEEQLARSDQAARLANALLADPEGELEEEEEELPPPPPVQVSVILSGPTSKVAVLNGITLREGDFLGQELLLEIQPNHVVLARGETQRVVSIHGGAKK